MTISPFTSRSYSVDPPVSAGGSAFYTVECKEQAGRIRLYAYGLGRAGRETIELTPREGSEPGRILPRPGSATAPLVEALVEIGALEATGLPVAVDGILVTPYLFCPHRLAPLTPCGVCGRETRSDSIRYASSRLPLCDRCEEPEEIQ